MRKTIKVTVVLGVMILFSLHAYCETTEENNAYQLEDIKVTAQKKEENMQDVPISMDVFSDYQIEDAKIENTYNLIQFSPNVFMKQSHVEHDLVIRGISSFKSSTYSPAGYYVDDVSYPLHYMQNVELFDVERAEILKGPQATLYGRNSESGVVNIITKQPDNEFKSKIYGKYGNYNTIRSGTTISGPIINDKLYIGAAFQYNTSDGYTENKANGDDNVMDWDHINGRANLRWTPSDTWDISFIADAVDYSDHGGGYRYLTGPYYSDPFEVYKDCEEYINQNGNSQILRIKHKGDAFDILSVSSILYQSLDKHNDSDLWNASNNQKENTFKIRERQYSQEIRISSSQKETFEWLVGLYGFIEDASFNYQYDIISKNMTYMHPVTDIDSVGYAVFGQGTYTLFNKLHLTGGIRFDHQDLDGEQKDEVKNEACSGEMGFDEILPKVSISYDISKDFMAYVSTSKGYLVGGYNWLNATDKTFKYDPEYTWNYETGIKTTWLNGKLMANLSIFYIDIDDKQVTEYDYDTLATTVTNAAKAHSQGIELQFQAKPIIGLDLFAGFGYSKAEYDDFKATGWNQDNTELIESDYENNELPYAPQYTYNLGLQYRYKNGLFFRADFFGTDQFYGDSANTSKQNSYELLDLCLGYEKEHYDLSLWSKNIFDEEYCTYIFPHGSFTGGLDGAPRTIGATLTLRF